MDESLFEVITNSKRIDELANALSLLLKKIENVFSFSYLNENNKRAVLWTTLFEKLQDKSLINLQFLCLSVIRVLSRDKTDLDNLICEKWISVLIDLAGLHTLISLDEEVIQSRDYCESNVVVEALKCLCNLTFNCEVARALCAHTCIGQGLVARLRIYKDMPFKDEIMLFDLKLLFILTAFRQDIKNKIKYDLHGMDYLTSCLNELLKEATSTTRAHFASDGLVEGGHRYFLNDNQHAIVCEVLKTQFNLVISSNSDDSTDDKEEAIYLKLVPVLSCFLLTQTANEEKLMELRSNVCNLLTCVPTAHYVLLTPVLNENEISRCTYDDRNMDALQALVELLQYRLKNTTNTINQYENLSPILTVMNKAVSGCSSQRKYLRSVVLPPLRDVSVAPEKGNTLRNQLCRLLTTPVTSVRDLVAEFIFMLCKEKVGRMVKYTGFGNAAGHLAQKGLLGGGRGRTYSSSSDDSDTEEYLEAQPNIDPVVGCTRPARPSPFENMTDEQKEYEAMKLVNIFDKMLSDGVVRPARIGPDGRPQPVEHVLELREHPPNRPQS